MTAEVRRLPALVHGCPLRFLVRFDDRSLTLEVVGADYPTRLRCDGRDDVEAALGASLVTPQTMERARRLVLEVLRAEFPRESITVDVEPVRR